MCCERKCLICYWILTSFNSVLCACTTSSYCFLLTYSCYCCCRYYIVHSTYNILLLLSVSVMRDWRCTTDDEYEFTFGENHDFARLPHLHHFTPSEYGCYISLSISNQHRRQTMVSMHQHAQIKIINEMIMNMNNEYANITISYGDTCFSAEKNFFNRIMSNLIECGEKLCACASKWCHSHQRHPSVHRPLHTFRKTLMATNFVYQFQHKLEALMPSPPVKNNTCHSGVNVARITIMKLCSEYDLNPRATCVKIKPGSAVRGWRQREIVNNNYVDGFISISFLRFTNQLRLLLLAVVNAMNISLQKVGRTFHFSILISFSFALMGPHGDNKLIRQNFKCWPWTKLYNFGYVWLQSLSNITVTTYAHRSGHVIAFLLSTGSVLAPLRCENLSTGLAPRRC